MKGSHTWKTIEAYDKNAQNYADMFDSYAPYATKISDFQNSFIADGANILDLGCGPGNNINTIIKHKPNCRVTGIDLSEQFIKIAKKRFPQFQFMQKHILDISLNTKYDVVLASFCIVHLTNQETGELFNKISTVLKDKGTMYLSYMNGSNQGFESTSFSNDPIFFNYYNDEFIVKLLDKNSLKVAEMSKEKYKEQDGSITMDTFVYLIKRGFAPI